MPVHRLASMAACVAPIWSGALMVLLSSMRRIVFTVVGPAVNEVSRTNAKDEDFIEFVEIPRYIVGNPNHKQPCSCGSCTVPFGGGPVCGLPIAVR